MIGVSGIVPKVSAPGPALPGGSGNRATLEVSAPVDGVIISDAAMAAAEAARFAVLSVGDQDVREELVAKARESIEQGLYRIQEVVVEVAKHLIPALG